MTPGVSSLESKPVSEASIDPNLQCMVMRITRGLLHGNGSNASQSAISIDYRLSRKIAPGGLGNRKSGARNNIIERNVTSPEVQTMVTYIGDFCHGILDDLARDGYIPLPAVRRAIILINSVEA